VGVVPSLPTGHGELPGHDARTRAKIFQYRGEVHAAGTIGGNTITIDARINTGSAPRS